MDRVTAVRRVNAPLNTAAILADINVTSYPRHQSRGIGAGEWTYVRPVQHHIFNRKRRGLGKGNASRIDIGMRRHQVIGVLGTDAARAGKNGVAEIEHIRVRQMPHEKRGARVIVRARA